VTITAEEMAIARTAVMKLRRALPMHHEFDDLVSAAYLALAKAKARGVPERSLGRAVRFGVIDQVRALDGFWRAREHNFITFCEYRPGDSRQMDAGQERAVLYRELREAVGRLPHRQAEVIQLLLGGMNTASIARARGVTRGAIFQTREAAIRKLRVAMGVA